MGHVYFVAGWLCSLATPAEVFSYYAMGHLEHHQHSGRSSISDFVWEPWWEGKDADLLFWGFSSRHPFKSAEIPLSPLLGPLAYIFYGSPIFNLVVMRLTAGSAWKFGMSSQSCSVLLLGAIKLWLMAHTAWFYPFHTYLVCMVFVAINLHFSLLGFYVPLTHPDRRTRSPGLHFNLQKRYGGDYPAFTPEFPTWVHNWVFLGLTYHIEHHCFPLVPWYNLHLVHEDLLRVSSDEMTYPQPALVDICYDEVPDRIVHSSELSKHSSVDSLWVAISGVVIDLTTWYMNHPGGANLLLDRAGTDISIDYLKQHRDLTNVMAHLHDGIVFIGRLGADDAESAMPSVAISAEEPLLVNASHTRNI